MAKITQCCVTIEWWDDEGNHGHTPIAPIQMVNCAPMSSIQADINAALECCQPEDEEERKVIKALESYLRRNREWLTKRQQAASARSLKS